MRTPSAANTSWTLRLTVGGIFLASAEGLFRAWVALGLPLEWAAFTPARVVTFVTALLTTH